MTTADTLPSWIARDRETLRRDNTPVVDTYHRAYSEAARRLSRPGEANNLTSAAYYLDHMADEIIAPCASALKQHQPPSSRSMKGTKWKMQEYDLWLGWMPHHIAYGLGWRLRPACEIFASNGHPAIVEDYHEWADNFLVRAQAMLDVHNALGRKESRLGSAAVEPMRIVTDGAREGLVRIVNMLRLDAKTAKLLRGFDSALQASYGRD